MKYKHKKIKIGNYTFNLTYSDFIDDSLEVILLSANFSFDIYPDRDMTEKEFNKGQALKQAIFYGKYKEQLSKIDWID